MEVSFQRYIIGHGKKEDLIKQKVIFKVILFQKDKQYEPSLNQGFSNLMMTKTPNKMNLLGTPFLNIHL